MKRTILKLGTILALLLVAAWLFRDATVFVLYKADPMTGRERGCYTEMENLLGIKSPTSWIRILELVVSGIVALAGLAVWFRKRQPQ